MRRAVKARTERGREKEGERGERKVPHTGHQIQYLTPPFLANIRTAVRDRGRERKGKRNAIARVRAFCAVQCVVDVAADAKRRVLPRDH